MASDTWMVAHNDDDTVLDPNNDPTTWNFIFGKSDVNIQAGMRVSIDIEDGSTIDSATLEVYGVGELSDAFIAEIRLYDQDSCPDFTNDPSGYGTVGNVSWDVSAGGGWDSAGWNTSPEIKTLIQSFIDRPGYSVNNYIGLRVDQGDAGAWEYVWGHAHDNDNTKAPRINVTWTPPVSGGAQTSVAISMMRQGML